MPIQQVSMETKAKNLKPEVLSDLLRPRAFELPKISIDKPELMIDPFNAYDPILDKYLSSISISGIDTSNPKFIEEILRNRQKDLAFGPGIEGFIREKLTPKGLLTEPFRSGWARYESPGDLWAVTSTSGVLPESPNLNSTMFGLMKADKALLALEADLNRKGLTPDVPEQFKILEFRYLPRVMSDYTLALRSASRRNIGNKEFNIANFRNEHFGLDPANPDMTGIFRQIKQEYLGKTNWQTVVFTEALLRGVDYLIGMVPVLGSFWDFSQAATGEELPIPGLERLVRHRLAKNNTPLTADIFKKHGKGRLLELTEGVINLAPIAALMLPPVWLGAVGAWLAKVPVDYLIEGVAFVDKMQESKKLAGPLKQIAVDSGTVPVAVEKISGLLGAFIRRFSKGVPK
jgi:hypothetical protein